MEQNIYEEVALTRDTFLNSEIEFLKQLVEMPEFLPMLTMYVKYNIGQLSERLTALTQKMENGEVSEDEEQKVELEIMCCCLAIEDKIKVKGPKVLTPENKNELTNGRSR